MKRDSAKRKESVKTVQSIEIVHVALRKDVVESVRERLWLSSKWSHDKRGE